MRLYGPHCAHARCPQDVCTDSTPTVHYPCSDQEVCPSCGPDGAYWDDVVPHMRAQLLHHFGTINPDEIRKASHVAANIQAECVRYAVLLRDHSTRP